MRLGVLESWTVVRRLDGCLSTLVRAQRPPTFVLSVGLISYYLCGSPSARSSIWIERLTTDQKVGGSSPSGRATETLVMYGLSSLASPSLALGTAS